MLRAGGQVSAFVGAIMTIVPAVVAGVKEIVACLPPNAHRAMVAGCHLSGPIASFASAGRRPWRPWPMARKVSRGSPRSWARQCLCERGKAQVFGPVGIDQLAGPSEIFILADETGDAEMIATDLLAQAEHDVRTRVGLITTHGPLAEAVLVEVEHQLAELSTSAVAGPAWRDYGLIAVAHDEADMIAFSEEIAAEHLQVHTRDSMAFAKKLDNYGSLFIGTNASVVYSDKCSGTNHTLPTMGAGQYTGGLWVGSYVKVATHQWLTEEGVRQVAPPAVRQSSSEGLEGHRRAAALRLERMQAR